MRNFVRRMVSFIRSGLKSSISSWGSWVAGTGSVETLLALSDTEELRKLRVKVERQYTEMWSMRLSPVFDAGLFCPERTNRPYGMQCQLDNGHVGAHCAQGPHERPTNVSQRIRDHGVVHRVAWYHWNDKAKCREMHTTCGQFFTTRNRTRNQMVTCLRCL